MVGIDEGQQEARVVDQACGENWTVYHGDSAEVVKGLPTASIDFSVFSVPFSHLYVYSAHERDLGNSRNDEEFFQHYRFVSDELLRVMKPGRNIIVHCQNLTMTKTSYGVEGLRDFRGELIRHHVGSGWIFHGEVVVDRNPQGVAIRRKVKSLLFAQKNRDRVWLAPTITDYLLAFRRPGENAVPIRDDDVSNEDWIAWAHPVWDGVRETNVLNVREAREETDERHICPMSLDSIERCIRLWSNKGDTILDPFSGLGSTGYVALQHGRRYIGVEFKRSYYESSLKNLTEAERLASEPTLFDLVEE